jgi:putative hydroxymethylpyrimidine transport system permease protein
VTRFRPGSLFWTSAALVGVWQVWVWLSHIDALVAPSPAAVLLDLVLHPDVYVTSVATTLLVAALGLGLGMALGLVLSVLTYFSPFLAGVITPGAMLLRTVPVVAIIPVIARVLGYGQNTLIGVAVLISFFPAFVLIDSGLRAVPAGSQDLFTVLGAGRRTRLFRLALPAALPNALVALRLSAASCILVAVLSQYLIGTDGLGYALANARAYHQPARAWGIAVMTTALAVASFLNASRLERWGREHWKGTK